MTKKTYIGSTGTTFKERFRNHKRSLTTEKYKNETALSMYYWKEKKQGNEPSVKWNIKTEVKGRFNWKFGCPLCNRERLKIARAKKRKIAK